MWAYVASAAAARAADGVGAGVGTAAGAGGDGGAGTLSVSLPVPPADVFDASAEAGAAESGVAMFAVLKGAVAPLPERFAGDVIAASAGSLASSRRFSG